MENKKKSTCGRKPYPPETKKTAIAVRILPANARYIETYCKAKNVSMGVFIDRLLTEVREKQL